MTKKANKPYVVSVVDDDKAVRDALGNLLESVGLSVEPFVPRMSGLELQHHLSAKSRNLPIIFITAHANDEVRSQALQAGAVSFLYKPFSSEDLLSAVHSTLK